MMYARSEKNMADYNHASMLQPTQPEVIADATTVPADDSSPVYLFNLRFGSHVTVEGPDERIAFEVTDDTIALAFATPGQYTVTVKAPDVVLPTQIRIQATPLPSTTG